MSRLPGDSGGVALVTGASSGIGAELARQLAARGMTVALVARRADRLDALAEEISSATDDSRVRVSGHACDVAISEEVDRTAREVLDRYGRVDLLANVAGIAHHGLFKDHGAALAGRIMQTNYMGTVYWIQALLPHMRRLERAWIVNFSSFAGKLGQADEAAYSASKFAITGLSEALAAEFAPLGIHVHCVHPLLVETEMFTPEVIDRMPKNTLKRFIGASEFVEAVLHAIERGDPDIVVPRSMRWVPILRSIFPRWMGRTIARVKLRDLPDVTT